MKHGIYLLLLALAGSVYAQDTRPTKNDPAPGQEYEILYKVGRFDSNGVFHGTDYNDRRYLNKADCANGFEDTLGRVAEAAYEKGSSPDVQAEHVKKFKQLYACQEITVDPNHDIQPQILADEIQRQADSQIRTPARRPAYQAPREEPRYEEPEVMPQPDAPRYNLPSVRQAMPTRPYYVAEYVTQPGYKPYWVKYAAVYESPAQCHGALRDMLREEQGKLEAGFIRTARDYNAAVNYQYQMAQFQARAKKLSCVSEGRF